jgi:hypothetical protein
MVEHRLLTSARTTLRVTVIALAVMLDIPAFGQVDSREGLTLDIPLSPQRSVDCLAPGHGGLSDLATIVAAMRIGPDRAVACVAWLEKSEPGWQRSEAAQSLVAPFVSYLLGDGSARGMQRHAIFVELLGPLEKIAPDWRLRSEVRALMPEIILGSVVEDPFVADFWSTALDEMDSGWRHSPEAELLVPKLYELAILAQEKPPDRRNHRPSELLKVVSRMDYALLIWETQLFSTWPRRILWLLVALGLLGFAARRLWRR